MPDLLTGSTLQWVHQIVVQRHCIRRTIAAVRSCATGSKPGKSAAFLRDAVRNTMLGRKARLPRRAIGTFAEVEMHIAKCRLYQLALCVMDSSLGRDDRIRVEDPRVPVVTVLVSGKAPRPRAVSVARPG